MLIEIARVGAADGIVPPYTTQRLHDELELFRVWLVEGLLGRSLTKAEGGLVDAVWRQLIESIDSQPKVCVHRDFHSRNLLWGIDRIDPAARGSYTFRPLLVPGIMLLWPLVLRRWQTLEKLKD